MKETDAFPDDVMSYKGLSAYLKLSQGTLRQKVMKGTIPFFKIGGAVRFSKKKIDVWIEERHRETKPVQVQDSSELFTDGGGQ